MTALQEIRKSIWNIVVDECRDCLLHKVVPCKSNCCLYQFYDRLKEDLKREEVTIKMKQRG